MRPRIRLAVGALVILQTFCARAEPLTVTWDALAAVPTARTEVTATAIGNKIYVIGGLTAGAGTTVGTRTVEIFDVETGGWSPGPDLPIPLHHTTAVGVGGKL